MMNMILSSLRPHPMNQYIYGDNYDEDLKVSIAQHGILTPLLITGKGAEVGENVIISGHRRYAVAVAYEFENAPCVISPLINEIEIEEAVIHANKQRKKTTEQIAREFTQLKRIEESKAKERQREAAYATTEKVNSVDNHECVNNKALGDHDPQANSENIRAPRARDLAAEKTGSGMAGRTLEKAEKVVEVIDDLEESGHEDEAKELRDTLNTSVRKATESIKPIIQAKESYIEKPSKTVTKKSFNATNDNIEWAKWSWNPVTGCLHGCKYCYARDIANRFYGHFDPEYHEDRIDAPGNTTIPERRIDEPGINNVFVCSMADLFGKWVDPQWIESVMDSVKQYPQWNYLFLTKNPKRYIEFEYTPSCWLGATADTQNRADAALKAFADLGDKGQHVNFLSCEPLLEPVVLGEGAALLDWLIIGGQSKSSGAPEFQPEWQWVESLLQEARAADMKVYFKPNLKCRPVEYPE